MPVLMRMTFLLLVLANLAVFIWNAGYLGGRPADREPERLANQLFADKVQLMPPSQSMSCRQLSGLDAAAASELRELFAGERHVELQTTTSSPATAYWIAIPSLDAADLATRKQGELRAFGITDAQVLEDSKYGPFAVSIALFEDAARAQKFFDDITARGVRSARLLIRETHPPEKQLSLRWPKADDARLSETLTHWLSELPAGSAAKLATCVTH